MALQPVNNTDDENIWTFGDRIRKIRKLLELDQDEFGAHFGVKKAAVSKWERDDGKGPEDLLFAVQKMSALAREAGHFWATPAWILGLTTEPTWYAAWDSNPEPTDSGSWLTLWDEPIAA